MKVAMSSMARGFMMLDPLHLPDRSRQYVIRMALPTRRVLARSRSAPHPGPIEDDFDPPAKAARGLQGATALVGSCRRDLALRPW